MGIIPAPDSSLIESDSLKATAFESLGVSCYYNGDYDSAYVYYNQALELHRIIVNEEGIVFN